MHRYLIVVVAALALVITGSTASPAQKPAKPKPTPTPGPYVQPVGITIKASQNPIVFPSGVSFTGRVEGVRGGVVVTLQGATTLTGTYANLANTKTDNAGRYTVGNRPTRNLFYRVVAANPRSQSATILVKVRPLIGLRVSDSTPARGQSVRFSGTVRPRHNGRTIYIQRRSATGAWFTVVKTKLVARDASSSSYAIRARVRRSGTYRAKTLGHSDHTTGYSSLRTLTVH